VRSTMARAAGRAMGRQCCDGVQAQRVDEDDKVVADGKPAMLLRATSLVRHWPPAYYGMPRRPWRTGANLWSAPGETRGGATTKAYYKFMDRIEG